MVSQSASCTSSRPAAFFLQPVDAGPEHFGDNAAEAAQPHHDEIQRGRHVGGVAGVGLRHPRAAVVGEPAALPRGQHDQQGEEQNPRKTFSNHALFIAEFAFGRNENGVCPALQARRFYLAFRSLSTALRSRLRDSLIP